MNMTIKGLAKYLVNRTFIPYQYFEVGSLLLLNISLSDDPNRHQEYEVFKRHDETKMFYKCDQVTVSMMDEVALNELLMEYDQTAIEDLTVCWGDQPLLDLPLLVKRKEVYTFGRNFIYFDNFERFKGEFAKFERAY
ncbi:hypothetical protein [Desertibacillus haloalkaliphilus]|uniref:hypothetical protein n=1 Tax=Desertibacillus haloalkaliphilus TaxID=1328930 RepID=UPI001C27196C|nr:hypothetical protein [Desertibacillus haloalkaliphilus]MBU8908180.1 hypothetical protein [Desertibacillus haloalkaliphilus]